MSNHNSPRQFQPYSDNPLDGDNDQQQQQQQQQHSSGGARRRQPMVDHPSAFVTRQYPAYATGSLRQAHHTGLADPHDDDDEFSGFAFPSYAELPFTSMKRRRRMRQLKSSKSHELLKWAMRGVFCSPLIALVIWSVCTVAYTNKQVQNVSMKASRRSSRRNAIKFFPNKQMPLNLQQAPLTSVAMTGNSAQEVSATEEAEDTVAIPLGASVATATTAPMPEEQSSIKIILQPISAATKSKANKDHNKFIPFHVPLGNSQPTKPPTKPPTRAPTPSPTTIAPTSAPFAELIFVPLPPRGQSQGVTFTILPKDPPPPPLPPLPKPPRTEVQAVDAPDKTYLVKHTGNHSVVHMRDQKAIYYYDPGAATASNGDLHVPSIVYDSAGQPVRIQALQGAEITMERPQTASLRGTMQAPPEMGISVKEITENVNAWGESSAQDQLIIISTVAVMALLVGAVSAKRMKQGAFCIESDTLEDSVAYDTATHAALGNGPGSSYNTFGTQVVPPGSGWMGDLEKFDV